MTGTPIRILGFSGSLRAGSYNSMMLSHFASRLPDHVSYEQAQIADLPHFDADLMADGFPKPAERLVAQAQAADAVVFATPEYNFSVPGVLKNAIDWVSRGKPAPLAGKPVAIMSASTSMLGGARGQYHLRQMLVFLDAHPVNKPEIFINFAPQKFDDTGALTDTVAAGLGGDMISALLQWQAMIAP